MTNNPRRGYDFERRVADFFRKVQGAEHVIRVGGSRGPADLYVFYPPDSPLTRHLTRVELIQCKRNGRLDPGERTRLIDLAERLHAKAVLASAGPHGRGVVLEHVQRPL
jgi:hypothetical protein